MNATQVHSCWHHCEYVNEYLGKSQQPEARHLELTLPRMEQSYFLETWRMASVSMHPSGQQIPKKLSPLTDDRTKVIAYVLNLVSRTNLFNGKRSKTGLKTVSYLLKQTKRWLQMAGGTSPRTSIAPFSIFLISCNKERTLEKPDLYKEMVPVPGSEETDRDRVCNSLTVRLLLSSPQCLQPPTATDFLIGSHSHVVAEKRLFYWFLNFLPPWKG